MPLAAGARCATLELQRVARVRVPSSTIGRTLAVQRRRRVRPSWQAPSPDEAAHAVANERRLRDCCGPCPYSLVEEGGEVSAVVEIHGPVFVEQGG